VFTVDRVTNLYKWHYKNWTRYITFDFFELKQSIMPLVHVIQTPVMVNITLIVSTAAVWNDAIAMTLVMNKAAAMMAFTAASNMNEQPIILERAIMDFQPLADILAHHQFFIRSCRD
jgi:hypothetical protein